MKKILIFLIIPFNLLSQNIIWSETFESYSDGIQNAPNGKWTTSAGNCDDNNASPGTSTGNYWGVETTLGDKEFRCNDIEGLTCCGTYGGNNDNLFITENIDISNYTEISLFISLRAYDTDNDNFECTGCNAADVLTAQYKVDNSSWVTFAEMCGVDATYQNIECIDISNGNNLQIRILVGNQANEENYYFDDIFVYESSCSVVLPVELSSFSGIEDDGINKIEWVTESENGSSHFEILKSEDGDNWTKISTVPSSINSTETKIYNFTDWNIRPIINYYKLQQFDMDGNSETFGPIAVNNIKKLNVVNETNLLGQKIDSDYRGIIIVTYDNGEKDVIIR